MYKKKSKEERTEQKKQMQEKIEAEQDSIWFEKESLHQFLKFAATFYKYSYNNQLLIHAKNPNATMVDTYKKWSERKRQVRAGEKGIEIFAPTPKTAIVEEEVKDGDGKPALNKDNTVKTEKREVSYIDYRVVYVYDVSQTDGENLPELEALSEDPLYETKEDLFYALQNISNDVSIFLSASDMLDCISREYLAKKFKYAEDHEVEACSYILASFLQLENEDSHVSQLFRWANGQDKKVIANCMGRVQKAASEIIKNMEAENV